MKYSIIVSKIQCRINRLHTYLIVDKIFEERDYEYGV